MSNKNNKIIFSKETIIIILGLILEIATNFIKINNNYIRNGLIIAGVSLIFLGMILVRKNNPFASRKDQKLAQKIGFDFSGQFSEYRKVSDVINYSTWRQKLLDTYNTYDDAGKKKSISRDICYYLKESRRKADEKVDIVKTILIPAEFGIIASIYELDINHLSGEIKFVVVMILSAALCLLCSVEITSGNKVIRFIDDFCEVLHIPLENS